VIAWWLLACGWGEPAAGQLRTDVAGLGERLLLPPNAAAVRWLMQVAAVGRSGSGRADARVFAWVDTPGGAEAWLTATLGEPLGPRAHWVAAAVAEVLFTPGELSTLQHNGPRNTWKLACVRYPAAGAGLAEYRADVVLDCGDHVYVTLTAH